MLVFSANPEDYTARGKIITPLKDRIGSEINTHYPASLEEGMEITRREAWLNRAGTIIAVVWKGTAPRKRAKLIQATLNESTVHELKDDARAEAIKTFLAGRGWYRGAEVDRLSEEEAAINAAKLLGKIRELISIKDTAASALEREFTAVLARKLTQGGSREETEAALMKVCQEHLEEKDLATLHTAYQNGAFSNLFRR